MTTKRLWPVAALAAGLLVAGCAGGPLEAVPEEPEVDVAPAEPQVEAAPDGVPPSLWPSEKPTPVLVPGVPNCEGYDGVIAGFGTVEAALGHRYLTATFLNCNEDPFELVVEGEGGPLSLGHEELGYVHLHWLSNGACERGVQAIALTIGAERFTHADPEGCLQLGGDYAPERGADIDAEVSASPHPR